METFIWLVQDVCHKRCPTMNEVGGLKLCRECESDDRMKAAVHDLLSSDISCNNLRAGKVNSHSNHFS